MLQCLIPLTIASHILVETSPLHFGVVLSRAGKLLCGVCNRACEHIRAVEQGLIDDVEAIADLQSVLDGIEEVTVAVPSIVTRDTFGLEDANLAITVWPNCSSSMANKDFQTVIYSFDGSKQITG